MSININGLLIAVQLVFESVEALAVNRLRTVLSLLGVAIGIAAIIIISSVATSGRAVVFSELETFGLRTFWIFREHAPDDTLEKDIAGTGINEHDYKYILKQRLPAIERLSPVIDSGTANITATKHGESLQVRIIGVNQQFAYINGDHLQVGRFLSARDISERAHVAVIGSGVNEKLFSHISNPVGQKLSIGEDWFTVIGVLREKNRDLINSIGAGRGQETGSRVLIPYSTRQKNIGESDYVSYLQGQATHLGSAGYAIKGIVKILKHQHRGAFRYKGESMSSYVDTANRILKGVTLIGIVSAIVSLIVGGLAIMNIMTTSVIERTNEIGLRRAIGASQLAIRVQFLMESMLISLLGGACGVLVGIALIRLVTAISALQMHISIDGLVLAILSTLMIGVVSGYYPALKASRLVPVEALRYG